MNELLVAARQVQEVCFAQDWKFCFIGGLALLHWGEPRETVDVDLTLLTGFGQEEKYIAPLLAHFTGRLENTLAFALEHRVLLLRAPSGVGLDIALAGLPFETAAVTRAAPIAFTDQVTLRLCTAEDLIVMKAFAGRTKDWLDVEGIIARQVGQLDWPYIYAQLTPLVELKGTPEHVEQLKKRELEFGKIT